MLLILYHTSRKKTSKYQRGKPLCRACNGYYLFDHSKK
nr:MAG TPA: hypothetical protein [Caudoviricetes sp.]